jgi:cytochrome d ubiquinol oxidase subunit I
VGVIAGTISTFLMLFPTGDGQGKNVAFLQPPTLAAMEGLFQTENGAALVILGQPDLEKRRLDNPLTVPRALSFLTYQRWHAQVRGLESFPQDRWPDNIPLLYYSYHIMVGLGTILIGVMALGTIALWRGNLYGARPMLWLLMLALPFPYIATTAGWITAELGRQPWLIYGLMRTSTGYSPRVSPGSTLFTLIGFMGIYTILAILFLFLVGREIEEGPEHVAAPVPAAV